MSKGLEAFENIKIVMTKLFSGVERLDKELIIIEKELKDYEKQDNLIKIIKETIEFGIVDNKVEENENGDLTLCGRIGISLRKELAKKERQLFRDWILETCFPKELKSLKVIKECFALNSFDELVPNSKWYESEEKQNLLKEVLENE